MKVGRFHHRDEITTGDGLNRECNDEDEAVLRLGLSGSFPDANGPVLSMKACMFTNTPDEHFIIDALPEAPNVFVAAGFSGHGFKFSTLVGKILAELAADGATDYPVERFRLDRFDRADGS